MSGFNSLQAAAYDAAARQRHRAQFAGMSAYDRHKKMVHVSELVACCSAPS